MAFDLDAYVAKNDKPTFDLDAYVAKNEKPTKKEGAGMAALESYGNAATLGYLPQLQALTEKLLPNPGAKVDADLRAKGATLPGDKSYVELRDENIARHDQQKKDFPKATTAGTMAGIGATALAGGVLGGVAKGANTAARTWNAAKTGATLGAVANPGDTEGELSPIQPGDRAKNAALGATVGAAVQGGAETLGPLAKSVAEWIKVKAAQKATRALGRATPTQTAKMNATGQTEAIGRTLLDEGAIPVLGTPGRIAKRVDALQEKAGERVGQLLDEVDAQTVQFTPIKITKPRGGVVAQEEIQATPVRFDENPVKQSMPWLRDADAPPVLVRGEAQPIQGRLLEKSPFKITRGEVKTVPLADVDAQKLANKILKSEEFSAMKTTPGMEGTAAAIEKQVTTLAANGRLTLREAQKLRQRIDKSINFNKTVPEMRGAQEGLYMQRKALANEMNDAVNRVGAGNDALKQANRSYGNLAEADTILNKELARNQTNHAVSLTDTIAGGSGLVLGDTPEEKAAYGLLFGLMNKGKRSFGNAMAARGLNATSKLVAKVPALAAYAKDNPMAAQVLANRMTQGPENKSAEVNPILNDPTAMQLFRQNPSLLQAVQDDKLRKQIEAKISEPKDTAIKRKLSSE